MPMHSPVRTSVIGNRARCGILLFLLAVLAATVLAPTSALAAYTQTYGFASKWAIPAPPLGFAAKGMALAPNGNILVASSGSYVAEYTTAGAQVRTMGSGIELTQIDNIARGADSLWVLDDQSSVKKLDVDGNYAGVTISGLSLASGLAVDASGCVYVADHEDDTLGYQWWISKYSPAGALIVKFGTSGPSNKSWLWSAPSISVGPNWDVYVADSQGNMVRRYTPNAARTSYSPTAWWQNKAFETPNSVAADANGNVFVLDSSTNTVTKLSPTGTLLARWGGKGTTNGKFTTPWSLVVAANGNVFVDDRDALTVQQFRVEDLGPTTSAAATVAVSKGQKAKFKYKVDEDVGPSVNVSIKIYKGSTLKTTIDCGSVSQGVWHTKSWKCTLARGTYKWKVYATDGAGHAQRNIASKVLKVR